MNDNQWILQWKKTLSLILYWTSSRLNEPGIEHTKNYIKVAHKTRKRQEWKNPENRQPWENFNFTIFLEFFFILFYTFFPLLNSSLSCRSTFKCNSIRSLLIQECSTFQYSIQFTLHRSNSILFLKSKKKTLNFSICCWAQKKMWKNVINLPFLYSPFATFKASQVTRKKIA